MMCGKSTIILTAQMQVFQNFKVSRMVIHDLGSFMSESIPFHDDGIDQFIILNFVRVSIYEQDPHYSIRPILHELHYRCDLQQLFSLSLFRFVYSFR